MSWECNCKEAVESSREHMPGSYLVCPFCARTRAHVELLEDVRALLALDQGEDATAIVDRFRRAVAGYLGDEDADEDPQLPLEKVPTVAIEVIVGGDPEELLDSGHGLWQDPRSGRSYSVVACDDSRVVLRELGTGELNNLYVRRAELLAHYEPCEET